MVRYNPETKRQAILSVLNELEQAEDTTHKIVSKSEICRRAGVSRTFLRTNIELMEQVNDIMARKYDKSFRT